MAASRDYSRTEHNACYARAKAGIHPGVMQGDIQKEGLLWMLGRELARTGPKGGILAHEPGLDKTHVVAACMRGNPVTGPTLVVCRDWENLGQFVGKLKSFAHYTADDITETKASCRDTAGVTNPIVMTTYSVFRTGRTPPCLVNTEWGRIVLDEAHDIRNPATKACKELSRLRAPIKWLMTGTPLQNNISKEMQAYADRLGHQTNAGFNVDDIWAAVGQRRTQADNKRANPTNTLPRLTTRIIKLPFATAAERKCYKVAEKMCESNTNGGSITAIMRMRQACLSSALLSAGLKRSGEKRGRGDAPALPAFESRNPPSSKLEFLVTRITGLPKGDKALMFCHWTEELELARARLSTAGIKTATLDGKTTNRGKLLKDFNKDKNQDLLVIIIVNLQCGSTGLDLQCANHVFLTTPACNPCLEVQAIARAHRGGQKRAVFVYNLIISDTIEEEMYASQRGKQHDQCVWPVRVPKASGLPHL